MEEIKNKNVSGFPVSYAQRRMWFLSRLESRNLSNNTGIVAVLTGELKLDCLQKAFAQLVARHESFRTNFFQAASGELVQTVRIKQTTKINFFDISQLPPKARSSKQQEIVDKVSEESFDLEKDKLIRMACIRTSHQEHVLVIVLHHIISDAWTLAFFWNELSVFYEAFVNKSSAKLPPLTIQYKDYATWEQSSGYLKQYDQQRKYWLEKLKNSPALTNLPLDFSRPEAQTYNSKFIKIVLPGIKKEEVEKLSQKLNVTLYTLLLALFIILLHKISQEEDVVVGTYAANRDQAELERVAGILLNNLAIRTFPKPQKTFLQFVQEVNKTVLSAMNNKEYPFEKLIDELDLKREASHPPLFNTVFQIFNKDISVVEEAFTKFEKRTKFINSNFFQHDLILRAGIEDGKLVFGFVYNIDLFEEKSIQEIIKGFKNLLNIITDGYEKKLGSFSIFSLTIEKKFADKIKNNQIIRKSTKLSKLSFPGQVEVEKEIIRVWEKVLDRQEIKRTDNFFRLGGHSLKIIQVHDLLSKKYSGKISVAQLFSFPTVVDLARFICSEQEDKIVIKNKNKYKKEIGILLDAVKAGLVDVDSAIDKLTDL